MWFQFPSNFQVVRHPVHIQSFLSAPLPNCALQPIGRDRIEHFVSVAPISCQTTASCLNPDSEPDRDVDLADFAALQNNFGDVLEAFRLPCFETFLQDFKGPTLSAC